MKIPLGDMTESHLKNATNMVDRQIKALTKCELDAYAVMGSLNGEMAQMSIETDAMRIAEDIQKLRKTYTVLLKACYVRNINPF